MPRLVRLHIFSQIGLWLPQILYKWISRAPDALTRPVAKAAGLFDGRTA